MNRKISLLLLPLALFLNCCAGGQAGGSHGAARLKVASYNIQLSPDGEKNYWPDRKDAAKSLLAYRRFDIWGSQETYKHQIEYIIPDGYGYIGVGRDDGAEKGEYAPIFYSKAKLEVLKSGTFWISETPEKVSFGWGAKHRRICTWGEFKCRKTGKIFYFFNTHLDHRVEKAQEEGVKLIRAKVGEIAGKNTFFITGDFNIRLGDPKLKPIFDDPAISHAFAASLTPPYGPGGTYHAYTGVPRAFIDYIFVSKDVKVLSYAHLTDRAGKKLYDPSKPLKEQGVDYASDHFPVVAEVEF